MHVPMKMKALCDTYTPDNLNKRGVANLFSDCHCF